MEEARELKDKNKALEDRLRYLEDQRRKGNNETIGLEDRNKDIRTRLEGYKNGGIGSMVKVNED